MAQFSFERRVIGGWAEVLQIACDFCVLSFLTATPHGGPPFSLLVQVLTLSGQSILALMLSGESSNNYQCGQWNKKICQ